MILITGATGTVGSEVVKRLSAQGVDVRAVTRDLRKAEAHRLPHVQFVQGDLGFPAWQADGLVEEFAMYRRGETAGVEPGVQEALDLYPRSFEDFARDYALLFA